jgi:hypothetical protein
VISIWRGPVILEIPGEQGQSLVQRLLRKTRWLRTLQLDCIGHNEDLAAGLAAGGHYKGLFVRMNRIQATNVRTVLESLFENRAL